MLEAQIHNPLYFKLHSTGNVAILGEERLSLETGVMFGGEHYGFYLDISKDGENIVIPYATQCRVVGVQIVGDTLQVMEEHKYIPWRFHKVSGELCNEAVFSFLKRTEMAYLKEKFGIVDEDGLRQINEGVKPKNK